MLKWPEMIMIGAANRNVGKTELACRIITRLAETRPVYGVKITTIRDMAGGCPRGGKGCGVCSSLTTPFEITEESNRDNDKDTSRMLNAGAEKVFWLRVHDLHLDEGVEALKNCIPPGMPLICESNSARNSITPSVFLVIMKKGAETKKEHCKKVMPYADRIVEFFENHWSIEPNQIVFSSGKWRIMEKASAIILSGGKSRRAGTDKALIEINDMPAIELIASQLSEVFPEVLISANNPKPYEFLGLEIIPDIKLDCGPLMGMASCIEKSNNDLNFVTACDIPYQNTKFIRKLLDLAENHDAVMPISPEGNYEPLYAVYRKSILRPAMEILKNGGRRIVELIERAKVFSFETREMDWLKNLNTMEDFKNYSGDLKDFYKPGVQKL